MLLQLLRPKSNRTKAFHHLRKKLHAHHRRAVSHLHATHRHVAHLTRKHGVHIHKLRHHGQRAAATGVLATSLMAAVPAADLAKDRLPPVRAHLPTIEGQAVRPSFPAIEQTTPPELERPFVRRSPGGPRPISIAAGGIDIALRPRLSADEEAALSNLFFDRYGIRAHGELEGRRLNVVYGLMGGEQHLKRYPGDVVGNHRNNIDERPELAGIAPGLGAWGYFAPSQAEMTDEIVEREKFYIAAQTFLAPGWKEDTRGMYNWFRFRKVLVVNAVTGQACVAVIGDAGPALSTGKNFGGSPEVMDAVGLSRGSRKGPVVVFFVDDPQNRIPLGHVQ